MLIRVYYRSTGETFLKRGKRGLGGEGEYTLPVLVSALPPFMLSLGPYTAIHERRLPIGVGDGGEPVSALSSSGSGLITIAATGVLGGVGHCISINDEFFSSLYSIDYVILRYVMCSKSAIFQPHSHAIIYNRGPRDNLSLETSLS